MTTNENQTGGVSRRDLLKKGAVAGGIVWTAPIVLGGVAGAADAGTGSAPPPECRVYYAGQFVTQGGAEGIVGSTCTSIGSGAFCYRNSVPVYENGCSTVADWGLEGGVPVVYLYETLGGVEGGTVIYNVAGSSKANDCLDATVTKEGDLWRIEYDAFVPGPNGQSNAVSNVQFLFCIR